MNLPRLLVLIGAATLVIAVADFWTGAQMIGSVLFTLPVILCISQRSKWVLWITAAVAASLIIAVGVKNFGHVQIVSPWLGLINRALLVGNVLVFAALIHLWINSSRRRILETEKGELASNNLKAKNEQLENELTKIKTVNRGKRKPLVLTIKQYLSFVTQLSDRHRTMVVTVMCSGLRVPEVLSLRWDQVDFVTGLLSPLPAASNTTAQPIAGTAKEDIHLDPVLLEALLEWRNKSPGSGLVFPSHITGRCYHPGPIQQDYFRPAARKLGLHGLSWNTFRNSYSTWIDEEGSAEVQQKLMRHPSVPSIAASSDGQSKLKTKGSAKITRQVPPSSPPPPAEDLQVPAEAS
jgi:integrase